MLTSERLYEFLQYDQFNGRFYWVKDKGRSRKGQIAGRIRSDGYWAIKFDGVDYLCHRLAWFYIYGAWPMEIDHKNGKRSDFTLSNLRECTRSQNFANRGQKVGKALPKGVRKYRTRYQARIVVRGIEKNLGVFETVEDAATAYLSASKLIYGDFARGTNAM